MSVCPGDGLGFVGRVYPFSSRRPGYIETTLFVSGIGDLGVGELFFFFGFSACLGIGGVCAFPRIKGLHDAFLEGFNIFYYQTEGSKIRSAPARILPQVFLPSRTLLCKITRLSGLL